MDQNWWNLIMSPCRLKLILRIGILDRNSNIEQIHYWFLIKKGLRKEGSPKLGEVLSNQLLLYWKNKMHTFYSCGVIIAILTEVRLVGWGIFTVFPHIEWEITDNWLLCWRINLGWRKHGHEAVRVIILFEWMI